MSFKVYIFSIFLALMLFPSLHMSGQNTNGNVGLRTIVIDPGHGGKDPGAPGPDSRNSEKHIVLKISKLLGEKIRKEYPSVKVVYTRSGDTFPKLTDRVQIAHDNNADLFISIHCNSNSKKTASGSSAHILSRKDTRNPSRDLFEENLELTRLENSVIEFEDDQSTYKNFSAEDQILNNLLFHANFEYSVMLAQLIVDNLATNPFHKWGNGIHQNDFLLLKKMTCPAVLVETAFLSNQNERQLLVSEKWQEEIAERLFKAFKVYKDVYDGSVSAPVYEPSSPQAETVETSTSVQTGSDEFYGIQIMGLGRLLADNDPALKGMKVRALKSDSSSIYKYVYGAYGSSSDASAQLAAVRKKFPEAFVVVVKGNEVSRVK
ncbi:MAG: N-acetylmuramoyl-L-alanine amidase [Bacteroidales bacterium]|nr:N-acetylmuramoyl-L-alanine amidase [Bacteroidales bacterium]